MLNKQTVNIIFVAGAIAASALVAKQGIDYGRAKFKALLKQVEESQAKIDRLVEELQTLGVHDFDMYSSKYAEQTVDHTQAPVDTEEKKAEEVETVDVKKPEVVPAQGYLPVEEHFDYTNPRHIKSNMGDLTLDTVVNFDTNVDDFKEYIVRYIDSMEALDGPMTEERADRIYDKYVNVLEYPEADWERIRDTILSNITIQATELNEEFDDLTVEGVHLVRQEFGYTGNSPIRWMEVVMFYARRIGYEFPGIHSFATGFHHLASGYLYEEEYEYVMEMAEEFAQHGFDPENYPQGLFGSWSTIQRPLTIAEQFKEWRTTKFKENDIIG